MKTIAQIGSFDVENFGDLLFPDVLDYYLSNDYKVDLYSPKGGVKPFDNRVVYPISELKNNIKKYDAIIIGGGDVIRTDSRIFIVNDCYGYSSEPSLQLWAYPILLAKKNNIPVIFNAVGVTNDFTEDEKFLVKSIIDLVDYVSVRDTEAFNALNQIGVENIKIVPDSVFSISKYLKQEKLQTIYDNLVGKKYIPNLEDYVLFQHNSTNINNKDYFNDLINLIKRISKDHKVLLMPIGYIHDDNKVLNKIYDQHIKDVYKVDDKHKFSPVEMISIINKSYGYVGTSMHGAVVSSSYNKKIMIINQMNSKKLHGVSNIINKTELDVNLSYNFEYVYDKFFEKQKMIKITQITNKIDKHFYTIKEIINNKSFKKCDIDFEKYIKDFYDYSNNKEIYGCYIFDNYLNRKLFRYSINNNRIHYAINTSSIIKVIPVISNVFFINYIIINNKKRVINDYICDDFILECVPVNNMVDIVIDGRFVDTKELYFIYSNLKNDTKVLKKDNEKIKKEYEVLLSKYKKIESSFAYRILRKIKKVIKK